MTPAAKQSRIRVVSPIDGSLYFERPFATPAEVDACVRRARAAAADWAATPLERRAELCKRAVRALIPERGALAAEITHQMGRPLRHSPFELDGTLERALYMASLAPEALRPIVPSQRAGFERFIEQVPRGVVLVISPWNFPYLTAVNAVVPALVAGNTVLLKPSPQVPLCAERLRAAFVRVGVPEDAFQVVHSDEQGTHQMLQTQPGVDVVSFTGSTHGGYSIQRAIANRTVVSSLELGGKDPAYVRSDADLERAVEGIVDGALFNAGQSCCAVERVYVHRSVYSDFVEAAVEQTRSYRLGDPRADTTTLGPLVSAAAARRVHEQIESALAEGARAHVAGMDARTTRRAEPEAAYLHPEVLTGVDHGMRIMREETFGPVFGILPVADDREAIEYMNDSAYGLTASIWTRDVEAARSIGTRLHTGTVFMNRCDYLDPGLAWSGVGESGRGLSLSRLGYGLFVRPRSFHLRF